VARTRAQRRRPTLLLTFALAATLLVLLFARDVTRSAHGAIGPRRSENRSFAQLANLLITQENEFDSHLAYLLANGQTLTRPVFAARLGQLNQLLPTWVSEADQLRRPKLAHAINDAVVLLTEQRVDAYQSLFANVARALSLPWPAISATSKSVRDPARTLLDTSHEWNFDRWGLALEPGRATLLALTTRPTGARRCSQRPRSPPHEASASPQWRWRRRRFPHPRAPWYCRPSPRSTWPSR
jgi:hypothetical protein